MKRTLNGCCMSTALSVWTAAIVNRCGNLRFRKEDVTSAPEHTPHKLPVESKSRVENTCNKRHVDSCTRALLENLGKYLRGLPILYTRQNIRHNNSDVFRLTMKIQDKCMRFVIRSTIKT